MIKNRKKEPALPMKEYQLRAIPTVRAAKIKKVKEDRDEFVTWLTLSNGSKIEVPFGTEVTEGCYYVNDGRSFQIMTQQKFKKLYERKE